MKTTPVIALPWRGGTVSLVIEDGDKAVLKVVDVPAANPVGFASEAFKTLKACWHERETFPGSRFSNFSFVVTDSAELASAVGNPMSLLHSMQFRLDRCLNTTGILSS